MSAAQSTQNNHADSGVYESQRDLLLGNIFNVGGNSYLNPLSVTQSFNGVFLILHPSHRSHTNETHGTGDNPYRAQSQAHIHQNVAHRPMTNNRADIGDEVAQGRVHTLSEGLMHVEDIIQGTQGFGGTTTEPHATCGLNTRTNTHQCEEARVQRIIARFWRGLPVVVSQIAPILLGRLPGFSANRGRGTGTPQTLRFVQGLVLRVQWHCMEGFLILGAVLIAAIQNRNTSFSELRALLQSLQSMIARMRDHRLAPYASTFVAVLALCLMRKSYSPRSLTEPLAILHDPYQKDLHVPVAYFDSLNILKSFLKDQYAGSNAELFIEGNLFNIAINRRDGTKLDLLKLGVGQRIESKTRLVMAVVWRLLVKRCPDCDSAPLSFEADNWLYWYVLLQDTFRS